MAHERSEHTGGRTAPAILEPCVAIYQLPLPEGSRDSAYFRAICAKRGAVDIFGLKRTPVIGFGYCSLKS